MRIQEPGSASYREYRQFSTNLAGQEIAYISKPGLPNWDQVTPGTALAVENINLPEGVRLLVLGCGQGALVAGLGVQAAQGETWLADNSWIALQTAARTLELNSIPFRLHTEVQQIPGEGQPFDAAVIEMPKGRHLGRRWLLMAWEALAPGGALYLTGANTGGIKSMIRDAEALFGPAGIMGYKKGHRLAKLLRRRDPPSRPGWAYTPGVKPGTWNEFDVRLGDDLLTLRSLAGVFSWDRQDEGTRLLLEQMEIHPGERVLDLGCGYGLIGLEAARRGAGWVDLLDADLYAVASAQENIDRYGGEHNSVRAGDGLQDVAGDRYHLVAVNPPFHTGKEVNYAVTQTLIAESRQVLEPGGRILLVANRFIPYDREMGKYFRNVERIAATGQFHVLLGKNK